MDDNTGSTAADAAVPAHPMTIAGGTPWTDGRWAEYNLTDRALALDGVDGTAATASAEIVRNDPELLGCGMGPDADAHQHAGDAESGQRHDPWLYPARRSRRH